MNTIILLKMTLQDEICQYISITSQHYSEEVIPFVKVQVRLLNTGINKVPDVSIETEHLSPNISGEMREPSFVPPSGAYAFSRKMERLGSHNVYTPEYVFACGISLGMFSVCFIFALHVRATHVNTCSEIFQILFDNKYKR